MNSRLVDCNSLKSRVMCVSDVRIRGWGLSGVKWETTLVIYHTCTQTQQHNPRLSCPAKNWEAESSFKLLGSSPPYIKGRHSPRLHGRHISTITLLGTAPGHAEPPVAHNGIIVSGDCGHCRPCSRIYSPPPILGPLTLTSANISHALGAGACEALCLPGLKNFTMTQVC